MLNQGHLMTIDALTLSWFAKPLQGQLTLNECCQGNILHQAIVLTTEAINPLSKQALGYLNYLPYIWTPGELVVKHVIYPPIFRAYHKCKLNHQNLKSVLELTTYTLSILTTQLCSICIAITGIALIATGQVARGICFLSGPSYHLVSSLCGPYQLIDKLIESYFLPTLIILGFLYTPSVTGALCVLNIGYTVLKTTPIFIEKETLIINYLKDSLKSFKPLFGLNTLCYTSNALPITSKMIQNWLEATDEDIMINPQALCRYAYKDYQLPTLPFETLTQLFETLKEDQSLEHTLIEKLKEDPQFLDELQHACPEASMQQIKDELTTFINLWKERTKKTVLSYFCKRFEHFKTLINDQNPTAQEAKCQLQHLLVHLKQLKDSDQSTFITSFINLIKQGSIDTLFLKTAVATNLHLYLEQTDIYPLKLKILFEQCRYNLIKDEGLLPAALPQNIRPSVFVGFVPITQAESEAITLTDQLISFLPSQDFKSELLTQYRDNCLSIVQSADPTTSLKYAQNVLSSCGERYTQNLARLNDNPTLLHRFILLTLGIINISPTGLANIGKRRAPPRASLGIRPT